LLRILSAASAAFCRALHETGWKFPDPQGSCFVWARPPAGCTSIEAVYFMLEKAHILTAPGSGFGQEPGTLHFRTTFLPPREDIQALVEKMKKFHTSYVEKLQEN